ncbi:MAG: YbaK/EbsC family protein, partial [Patescibacteria group bacterium]
VIASPEALRVARQSKKKIASDALAMTNKDYFVLIVLPAGKYVDLKAVQKALSSAKGGSLPAGQAGTFGGKKVSMASEKDITKYLKTKVGLLHPFGSEYNLQTLLDKNLSRAKKMIASAGTYTHSIELSLKDFEKLVKPIKGAFAKAKR